MILLARSEELLAALDGLGEIGTMAAAKNAEDVASVGNRAAERPESAADD